MTRIIAGELGGRSLKVPATGTRPTSDRVREAIFSKLDHADALRGATVLDLYAGSGALGIEAVSRGASSAVLVDDAARAVQVIKANVAALGVGSRCSVVKDRASRYAAQPPATPWSLVFVDPPYDIDPLALDGVLAHLAGHMAEGAWVVVEASSRTREPTWPDRLNPLSPKKYGETTVHYAQAVR